MLNISLLHLRSALFRSLMRLYRVKLAIIRSIYILTLILVSYSGLNAQQSAQNLENYKNLRKRLVNDFSLPGEGKGKSLVAERRNGSDYPGRLIFHADEVSNMGLYIATLATEYKLLKSNGRPVLPTLEELGYALKAINRLDQTAESYLRNPANPEPPQPGDLNGFFIRSDVSHSFFNENSDHFNSGLYGSSPVSSVTSSFYDPTLQFAQPLRESQDQVLNIMMGLSFVSKYVHESLPGFTFQDNESNFSQEAKNITSRIVGYMKQNAWKIKDPVSGQMLTNLQGGEAYYLSYGFAEAACSILNEFTGTASGFPEKTCMTFHDQTTAMYYNVFQYMKTYIDCPQGTSTTTTDCHNCQELYKPMLLAAIGNSLYQSGINVTSSVLKQQGINTEISIMPLMHKVLWNTNTILPDSVYTSLLNHELPQGPYNNGNCNYPDFEWSAPVRWRQPERRGAGCAAEEQDTECFNFFSGEYNGLDYMLLFNLYCLSHPGYVTYDLTSPLGINTNNLSKGLKVLVENQFVVIDTHIEFSAVELYSIDGKAIFRDNEMNTKHFKIASYSLPAGIYVLRLTGKDQQQHTVKKVFIP